MEFTSHEFTHRLEEAHIRISRDGRGQALDNIFVECLWRSVKHEEVYLKDYDTVPTPLRIRRRIHLLQSEAVPSIVGLCNSCNSLLSTMKIGM